MRIVVCIKQVIDPEVPPSEFRIDPQKKEAVQGRANLVISTFDECALEVALQVKDKVPETTVTALTFGPKTAEEALRKALAMRADEAVRIDTDRTGRMDPAGVAQVVASAIQKMSGADVVLFGREGADFDSAQVGQMTAEALEMPLITLATEMEVGEKGIRARRHGDDGWSIVETPTPVALTITNAPVNVPRIPKVKDVMQAHRKPITTMTLDELGIDPAILSEAAPVELEELFIPEVNNQVTIIEGETPEEKAEKLAQAILALKVL